MTSPADTTDPAGPGRWITARAVAVLYCAATGEPPGALTPAERRALTTRLGTGYAHAGKAAKSRLLDTVCAATGWHRSHARRALLTAARPAAAASAARRGGQAKYGDTVVDALIFCWQILDLPAGKRLAPVLADLVPVLRRHHELDLDDATAALLVGMSAATIDRRLAPHRARQRPAAATRMRPGSLLCTEHPLLTWAEWDNSRPGFVEVSVLRHGESGGSGGSGPVTVSVTDVATGWTENRTVPALPATPSALDEIAGVLPFPVLGLNTGNHGAPVDEVLLGWCAPRRITCTRSRPASGGPHHVGQKNWSTVRAITGDRDHRTAAEVALLNTIWRALSKLTNYFYPQQYLVSTAERDGRRSKSYDTATPYRRVSRHRQVSAEDKAIQAEEYRQLNPAALHREVRAATARLHR